MDCKSGQKLDHKIGAQHWQGPKLAVQGCGCFAICAVVTCFSLTSGSSSTDLHVRKAKMSLIRPEEPPFQDVWE